jgi:NAD(P)-dependent dehydrogenase (short-subunit alcohol dehydrogenase family)
MSLPSEPRVVITGAGGGLGRALSIVAGERRARLLVSDVDAKGADETVRLAKAAGARDARSFACDVTKPEEVEALAKAADDAYGGTDLVVNNAGVAAAGPVGEVSLADWKWTIDVDLWGVIYGCHSFVPRMRKQGSGHVVNIASAAGLLTAPRMAPYNVAKAGVIALSETLSAELAVSGVGVTAVCPTFFRTNIVDGGRYTTPGMRKVAQMLIGRSKITADTVARGIFEAAERNELYYVPMADGRWMWRLKRLAPAAHAFINRTIEKRVMAEADA